MEKKYISLQVLRGLAAWFVVFHHFMLSVYVHHDVAINPFGRFLYTYGPFGVDIFFVLSGFVMYKVAQQKNVNGLSFLFNRIFRIFPVYWFYTVVLILAVFVFKGIYETFYTSATLLKSFLLIPSENPNGRGFIPFLYVGWSLYFEMFFYYVLTLSLFINRKYALLICVLALGILPIVLGNYELLGRSNNRFYEFIVGILIAYSLKNMISQFTKYKTLIAISLTIFSLAIVFLMGWTAPVQFLIASCILIIFICLENLFQKPTFVNHFLEKLGDISYSTYLCHPIFIGVILYFFGAQLSFWGNVLSLVTYTALIYLSSILSYRYIETSEGIIWAKNSGLNALTKTLTYLRLSRD